MNNCRGQFIKTIFYAAAVSLSMPVLSFAQTHIEEHRLLEIQQAYQRGEIDADRAALELFRNLYEPDVSAVGEKQIHKCAAPAFMFLHEHRSRLSSSVLDKIEKYQKEYRGSKKKHINLSYISPSGKFEILYDTTGADSVSVIDNDSNGVPDYIDRVAESADSSYRHEVENIGFPDPIPAGTTYKIYIEDIVFGAYGYTETTAGDGPLTVIYIENDFAGFPPNTHPEGNQIGSIYVTVAHEFKHAIQFAQNRWRAPSGAFDWAEMDATLMEEVVYDDVNDYYNYIKNGLNSSNPYSQSIFYAPQNGTPGAYWHVTWMIYYSELFGNEIWRDVWQLIEEDNFMSIDDALVEVMPDFGTDFETTFIQNHLWHFASGSRAGDDDYGFGEKDFYPNANMQESFAGVPSNETNMNDMSTLAARYFEVTPSVSDEGMIDVAVDFDSSQAGVGLLFYLKNGEMQELTAFGEDKPQLYVPSEISWQEVDKLGVIIANYSANVQTRDITMSIGKNGSPINIRDPDYADLPNAIKVYQNFPNPFNNNTRIRFELPRSAYVELEIFDVMGRKIKTLTNGERRLGSYDIPFDASGLSSGVYFYRLQIDDMAVVKKMTLVK